MKPVTDIATGQLMIPGMENAVDLTAHKDKDLHQHHWSMLARFGVPAEQVEELKATSVEFGSKMERRIRAAKEAAISQGLDPEDPASDIRVDLSGLTEPSLAFAYGPNNNLTMEGPGCVKCAILWSDPVKGVGHLCAMSDVDFVKQAGGAEVLSIFAEREAQWMATTAEMKKAMEQAKEQAEAQAAAQAQVQADEDAEMSRSEANTLAESDLLQNCDAVQEYDDIEEAELVSNVD
jgi:hypothetical protein